MNILAIDSGNTRIKWGLWEQEESGGEGMWTRVGALTHDESAGLRPALAALPAPQRIAVANVAGVGAAQCIEQACAGLGASIIWTQPKPEQCGVTNRYDTTQLGADR